MPDLIYLINDGTGGGSTTLVVYDFSVTVEEVQDISVTVEELEDIFVSVDEV